MEKKPVEKPKYWYKITIEECVLCGKQKKYKERVYKITEAGTFFTQYACQEHFI